MREYIIPYPDEITPELVRDLYKEERELVRCRDCKHKGVSYKCRLDSDLEEHGGYRTEIFDNWFCADGERKSD